MAFAVTHIAGMGRGHYPNFGRAQGRQRRPLATIAAFGGVIAVGAGIGLTLASPGLSSAITHTLTPAACRVVDGDTLRCGSERVRLLGIDAPELPGHCAVGRSCAPGDPVASRESLKDALTGDLTFDRVGTDRYGRTLALVAGRKGDLSCWQLEHGQAIYKPKWDNGGRVAARCPRFAG